MSPSKIQKQALGFLILLVFFSSSGATCIRKSTISEFQPPTLFQQTPDIQQISAALNKSQNIQRLQSNILNIRFPGNLGSVSANMHYEREKRFRVQGSASLGLGNIDLGSNENLFWMGLRYGTSPKMYVAQHALFEQQMNRQILPVSPMWLVEAMGIVSLDPYQVPEAPKLRPDGLMQVQSVSPSPVGNYTRTMLVDPKFGYVKNLYLNDPTGKLVALSTMSNQQYYSAVQYSLPHRVAVQLIPYGGETVDMVFDIHQYNVNSLEPNAPGLYDLPDTRGYEVEDLVQKNVGQTLPIQTQGVVPPAEPPNRFGYRGYEGPTLSR